MEFAKISSMQISRKGFIGLGCGLLVLALVIAFLPNEEKRVRKTFDRVAELLAKDGDEPVLTTAGKANGLSNLIAPKMHLEAKEIGLNESFDPTTLAQCATLMRAHERHITVTFSDISVDFPPDKENVANVLGNVAVDADHNLGFKDKESRTFEATLTKDEETDTWQFKNVKVHRVN